MQDVLNILSLGSIYLLFALGMSLVWGTINILNFAHGSIFMFSSFSVYLILGAVELPLIGLIAIGVIVGAVISFLVQVLVFEQILKRARNVAMAEMQCLIGSIGVATIPLAIAQLATKSTPFGLGMSSFQVDVWVIGGIRITNIAAITIALALILWALVWVWLRRSRSGLALRVIGVNPEVAGLMGVNRQRLARGAMALAGGLAGLAGVLLTLSLGAISAESGDALLIKAFACIVLGGVGSMAGVALGALLLAASETLVLTQTTGSWVEAVSFGLIFLVLLIRPSGVFGRKEVRRT